MDTLNVLSCFRAASVGCFHVQREIITSQRQYCYDNTVLLSLNPAALAACWQWAVIHSAEWKKSQVSSMVPTSCRELWTVGKMDRQAWRTFSVNTVAWSHTFTTITECFHGNNSLRVALSAACRLLWALFWPDLHPSARSTSTFSMSRPHYPA